ncbi:MAG: hypothetical protein ABJE95_07495 [Byssovorax sp.]
MLVCPRCTTENAEGALRCSYCAQALGAAPAPMAAWSPPVQTTALAFPAHLYPGMVTAPIVSRDGGKLVVPHGAHLPDRCVKCNAPAQGFRLRRRLTWLHPAYLFLLFGGLIIYAIASAVASKTAEIDVGLCPRHRKQRWQAILGGWALGLAGVTVMPWLAISLELWWIAAVGAGMTLVGMVGGILVARLVSPSKIDDSRVWLSGVDSRYLNELSAGPPNGGSPGVPLDPDLS